MSHGQYHTAMTFHIRMAGPSRIKVSMKLQVSDLAMEPLGKLVTEKPVDFVGFDNVVEFNKNRQNDDNVVKAYKDLFS